MQTRSKSNALHKLTASYLYLSEMSWLNIQIAIIQYAAIHFDLPTFVPKKNGPFIFSPFFFLCQRS